MSIRTEPKPSSPGQLAEPVTEGPGYSMAPERWEWVKWVSGRWTALEEDGLLFGRTNGTGEMDMCSAALAPNHPSWAAVSALQRPWRARKRIEELTRR